MLERIAQRVFAGIPFSWREPVIFRKTLAFLEESDRWSKDKIQEFQMRSAAAVIDHAFKTVPGYAKLFARAGVAPAHFQSLDDLRRFPFITKEILRDRPEDYVSSIIPRPKLHYTATGGATAVPFGFYWVRGYNIPIEKAFIFNLWKRVGYRIGEKTAVLRGAFVGNEEKKRFWRFNALTNETWFSSYHLTDRLIPVYLEKIRDSGIRFVQAYPSAAAIVAKFLQDHSEIRLPRLKGLFCGSENIFPGQRELIEKFWGCRVYSWYGHTESAILAGECENSNDYHCCPQYGITEIVDAQGKILTQEGAIGELVGTGFYGWATPFIRYRTRDLATLGKAFCKQCGRSHRTLSRIEGRFQELAVTAQGRLISMTAINMHTPVFDHVRQFQFVQERQGEIILKIAKKISYRDHDTQEIFRVINEKLGPDMKLLIAFTDQLEPTPSGKGRFLVQKLNTQQWLDRLTT
ncbi:MAG: phenylacetate--CoA ligase family protein [Elusimicrobia bacterium]|nr:phenylacetate--CoA ligase family protein [Elusimicrobiota bacterium]